MIKKRSDRQGVIRDIVRESSVRTQRSLVEELRARGFECTQATVSRDITEMGLQKLPEGTYVLPEDLRLQRMVHDMVVDVSRAGNLVVIHAMSGAAQGVAAALDTAGLPGILGSVAGDDTILVIASDDEHGASFEGMVRRLSSGE